GWVVGWGPGCVVLGGAGIPGAVSCTPEPGVVWPGPGVAPGAAGPDEAGPPSCPLAPTVGVLVVSPGTGATRSPLLSGGFWPAAAPDALAGGEECSRTGRPTAPARMTSAAAMPSHVRRADPPRRRPAYSVAGASSGSPPQSSC